MQEQLDKKTKAKENRKVIFGFAYLLFTIAIIVGIGVLSPDLQDALVMLKDLVPTWVGCAVLMLLAYWYFESASLHVLAYAINPSFKRSSAFKISMIGLYYSALTPFSSGGQPVQVMYMRKEGFTVGQGTCVFGVKFILFQAVLCPFFLISLVMKTTRLLGTNANLIWFTVIGFAVNFGLMLLVLLVLISDKKTAKLSDKLVHFLHRIHLIKNEEKANEQMHKTIAEFHESAVYIKDNKKVVLNGFLMTILQMGTYFSITYFVYRAFGLNSFGFIDVFTMQACLYLAVSFVPLPGASLASEGGFSIFFSLFFPTAGLMYLAMLMWRLLTYYANLIIGALFVVYDSLRSMGKKKKKASSSSDATPQG